MPYCLCSRKVWVSSGPRMSINCFIILLSRWPGWGWGTFSMKRNFRFSGNSISETNDGNTYLNTEIDLITFGTTVFSNSIDITSSLWVGAVSWGKFKDGNLSRQRYTKAIYLFFNSIHKSDGEINEYPTLLCWGSHQEPGTRTWYAITRSRWLGPRFRTTRSCRIGPGTIQLLANQIVLLRQEPSSNMTNHIPNHIIGLSEFML